MASPPPTQSWSQPRLQPFLLTLVILSLTPLPALAALVQQQPLVLKYHHGPLLKGNISVNLVWYGRFSPAQRSIIVDFLHSLGPAQHHPLPSPSAASWWKTTDKYSSSARGTKLPSTTSLAVSAQLLRPNYPLGKSLRNYHLRALASKPAPRSPVSITIVLTSDDVAVEGFCSRCGSHWSSGRDGGPTFIWVGNSASQCPGQCAWPFHQPIYGPQVPPLVPPNGDVGVDGMIINIATLLAGTATNPFGNGYFQGPTEAPLEAVTACAGAFGSGSYPGYPGKVLMDATTGGSYNANGANGRKFLLPAMWDPQFAACKTLV